MAALRTRSREEGPQSPNGLRLYTHEQTLGGLNMYSTQNAKIDPDARMTAEVFATHAALALGHARKESQLNDALASRKTIGQAIGILMGRYQINDERAFQFLFRASSTSNLKLRDIADEVVPKTNRDHAPDGDPEDAGPICCVIGDESNDTGSAPLLEAEPVRRPRRRAVLEGAGADHPPVPGPRWFT
jgi:hypothetical protein